MTDAPPRSYLFVPGDASGKLEQALERRADAIIVDLEDGVAPAARPAACGRHVAREPSSCRGALG